jgi:hypothetical protein
MQFKIYDVQYYRGKPTASKAFIEKQDLWFVLDFQLQNHALLLQQSFLNHSTIVSPFTAFSQIFQLKIYNNYLVISELWIQQRVLLKQAVSLPTSLATHLPLSHPSPFL